MSIKNRADTAQFDLYNPVHFLALGFGSGLMRPAPGTWGSLMGCLLFVLVMQWWQTDSIEFWLLCVSLSLVGVYICGRTANDVGVHDHGAIVWDEIAGIFVTLAFVPFSILALVVGFLLFRLFDIVKPWPIGWLDARVHGGIGIMVDDIVAALYAGCLLWMSSYFGFV